MKKLLLALAMSAMTLQAGNVLAEDETSSTPVSSPFNLLFENEVSPVDEPAPIPSTTYIPTTCNREVVYIDRVVYVNRVVYKYIDKEQPAFDAETETLIVPVVQYENEPTFSDVVLKHQGEGVFRLTNVKAYEPEQ